jgi:hypothetical protein
MSIFLKKVWFMMTNAAATRGVTQLRTFPAARPGLALCDQMSTR